MSTGSERLLTYEEVADNLAVCVRTVQRWVRGGLPGRKPRKPFPHMRMGSAVRFRPEDVEKVKDYLVVERVLPAKRGPKKGAA